MEFVIVFSLINIYVFMYIFFCIIEPMHMLVVSESNTQYAVKGYAKINICSINLRISLKEINLMPA